MTLRFPYRNFRPAHLIAPLGGRNVRPRPVLSVTLIGPRTSRAQDALLDTGSDDTVFPDHVAQRIGIDLTNAPLGYASGLPQGSAPVRYARVTLRLADNHERREWEAWVGFTAAQIRFPALGFIGFLQYFTATFHGDREEVELTENGIYPGTRSSRIRGEPQMSAKSPFLVIVAALVCGVIAWALSVHLFEEGPLEAVVICPIVSSLLVQGMVFLLGMMLRGTIRRRGIWGINFKRIICPHCGTHLRNGITPRSLEEYLLDDWTCHECGLELSRWGRPWKEQNTLAKWNVLRTVERSEQRRKRSQTREDRILNVNDQTQRGEVS